MIVRKLGDGCVRVWRGCEGLAHLHCGVQYANVIAGCKRKSAERMNQAPDGLPLSDAGGRRAAVCRRQVVHLRGGAISKLL